jgi:hypothetical protein
MRDANGMTTASACISNQKNIETKGNSHSKAKQSEGRARLLWPVCDRHIGPCARFAFVPGGSHGYGEGFCPLYERL